MKYDNKLTKRDVFVCMIIILLQLMVIVYWFNCKINYHVDELYSIGYAKGYFAPSDYWEKITDKDDYKLDNWFKVYELKKYLILAENEMVYNFSLVRILWKLLTGRSYFGLLNIAESFAGSYIGGVLLNSIFFVIAEIELISLMRKLKIDRIICYLAMAMFGFSGYIISAAEFIRFYMFIIMLMLIILNILYRIWISSDWKNIIINELMLLITVYFSYKNSELIIPFFFFFWSCFVVASFVNKKYKQLATEIVVCFFAFIYIVTQTRILNVLFQPGSINDPESVWVTSSLDIINNIKNLSLYWFTDLYMWVKGCFENYYFASRSIVYLFLCAITICLIITIVPDEKYIFDIKRINPLIPGAILIWIGVFCVSYVLGESIGISVLMIYALLVVAFIQISGLKFDTLLSGLSQDTVFALLLMVAALLSMFFEGLCSHRIWRYYCYGFVSLTIVLWYAIDRGLKKSAFSLARRPMLMILTAIVLVNSLMPFVKRNIEYTFEDERYFVDYINSIDNMNIVLVQTSDDGKSKHTLYDCVNMVPDDAEICIVDLDKYDYHRIDYPDELVIWAHSEVDVDTIVNYFNDNGFDVKEIGTDHCSRVFCAERDSIDRI